jgi:hemin uptake protein HemP
MTESQRQPEDKAQDEDRTDAPPRIIDADTLFQGTREVCIELAGVRYRLRITRRNKLILQK